MRRSDWHGVTLASCAGIALVYVVFANVRKDHRVITIFEKEGQEIIKNHLRCDFPELAKMIGVDQ